MEAQSTIDALKLKRVHSLHQFAVFANDNVALIESGQGAVNAACAVGYMAALLTPKTPAWLNIGIAGHATFKIGSLVIAHKVRDDSSSDSYYPLLGPISGIDSVTIQSVAAPELNYDSNDVYDMEAYSFFRAAVKFSSVEFIHCLKVISDNRNAPANLLAIKGQRQFLAEVIQQRQCEITAVITQLSELVERQSTLRKTPSLVEELLRLYHFSENQKIQLRHLIQQWQGIASQPIIDLSNTPRFTSGKHLLEHLQQSYLQYCENFFLQP